MTDSQDGFCYVQGIRLSFFTRCVHRCYYKSLDQHVFQLYVRKMNSGKFTPFLRGEQSWTSGVTVWEVNIHETDGPLSFSQPSLGDVTQHQFKEVWDLRSRVNVKGSPKDLLQYKTCLLKSCTKGVDCLFCPLQQLWRTSWKMPIRFRKGSWCCWVISLLRPPGCLESWTV